MTQTWLDKLLTWPAFFVTLALMLLGVALLRWGLLRFSHGTIKVCRSCGYHLHDQKQQRCPECGNTAQVKKQLVLLPFRLELLFVCILSLLLGLPLIFTGVVAGTRRVKGAYASLVDQMHQELIAEGGGDNVAFRELSVPDAIDVLLKRQADFDVNWRINWGMQIEEQWSELTEKQQTEYLHGGIQIDLMGIEEGFGDGVYRVYFRQGGVRWGNAQHHLDITSVEVDGVKAVFLAPEGRERVRFSCQSNPVFSVPMGAGGGASFCVRLPKLSVNSEVGVRMEYEHSLSIFPDKQSAVCTEQIQKSMTVTPTTDPDLLLLKSLNGDDQ